MGGYGASASAEGVRGEAFEGGVGEAEASSAVMQGIVAQQASTTYPHRGVLHVSDHIDIFVAPMYATDVAHLGGCDATVGISIEGQRRCAADGESLVAPSVLIVSEELSFLVSCYNGLHRDERIGKIEATANRDEAVGLVQTLHPDVVVYDSSAGDSFGVSAIGRLCELAPDMTVVVTFRDHEQQAIEMTARSSGATGIFSRDAFSAEQLLRVMRTRGGRGRQSTGAPA
jgi:hypothetical protein